VNPAYPYLCWCFDEAILYFGRWVDNKLNITHRKGPNKGKRVYSLAQLLNPDYKERHESKSLLSLMALGGGFAGPAHL
jgi:hypothetical protein